jgi:hypothetical protein
MTKRIALIFLGVVACDSVPKRAEGTCLRSYVYGGPYLVKKDGWDLVVVDAKTNANERKLPNDRSWATVECPR